MESREPSPNVSLGIRIAIFTSVSVLAAVLIAALAVEIQGRNDARREASEVLRRAQNLAAAHLDREGETLERLAVTVARDPKFFALLALPPSDRSPTYRPALEGVIHQFQGDVNAEIFDVTDAAGITVGASARPSAPEANRAASPLVRRALAGEPARGYRLEGGRLYRISVAPVLAGGDAPIGTLTLGAPIGDEFATAVHSTTGADVVLLAAEGSPGAGASPDPRPVASTLPQAGTRSLLETLGPSPRAIGRSRLRDERAVWIAKTQAVALDVSLDAPIEGGVARLVVAAPVGVGASASAIRETLLAAGAVAAALSLFVGFVFGRRLSSRLLTLDEAAREAEIGNFDAPLPAPAADELGILTADFGAMRHRQRREIDRLVELDRMKTDFLTVAAQEILAPATEIKDAGDTLARRAAPALGPEGLKRLRVIQGGADTLARLAHDLGSASVVLTTAAPPPSPTAEGSANEASVQVVSRESAFEPAIAPAAPTAPATPVAAAESAPPDADADAVPPAAPDRAEVDIARLVEGVAVDLIVAGAERAIEVMIEVESDLFHPTADGAEIERSLREHGARALADLVPGATLTVAARRTASGIEIRLDGGAVPFGLVLPLPESSSPLGERAAS